LFDSIDNPDNLNSNSLNAYNNNNNNNNISGVQPLILGQNLVPNPIITPYISTQQSPLQAQYQSLLQAIPPQIQAQPLPGVILVPNPANSSFQLQQVPQFIPIQIQPPPASIQAHSISTSQQQQPSMIYPEQHMQPIQPMFYNQPFSLANYPSQNYYNQPNDFATDAYEYQAYESFQNQGQMNEKRNQHHHHQHQQQNSPKQNIYSNKNNNTNNSLNNRVQRANKLFKANNYSNNLDNETNSLSSNIHSIDSYNEDEMADLNNDFVSFKVDDDVYMQQAKNKDDLNEDLKRQQVWKKLQKANRDKHNSGSKQKKQLTISSLPPVNKGAIKKLQAENKKPEINYLEKNIEALKNKENLSHRYPEKTYGNLHGKNINTRFKNLNGYF
jgi:hypothetical protein